MSIKILYITNGINGAAGLERVLSIKTNYLIENFGYEIHFITLNQGDSELFYEFNKKIQHHDITAAGSPLNYIISYIKGLNNIVKKINPDIISVCDDGLKGFYVPLIIQKPCPMVYERHVSKNIEITKDKTSLKAKILTWVKYKLMHFGARFYDKFVVLTSGNLKEWSLNNLMVINNPLSFDENVPKSTLNRKIVLAVGRHDYQKGYDRLLEIWERISKKYPDWQLHIYGKKNTELGFEAMADNLNISNTVSFFDPVKNISAIYQKASIYLMSSRFEGFGMVLTEAMIHGVPAISFNCPYGPSDIIDNGYNGILVANGNIDSFAESLELLIVNNTLRKEMGSRAIHKALTFHPDKIIEEWDNLFKSLKN